MKHNLILLITILFAMLITTSVSANTLSIDLKDGEPKLEYVEVKTEKSLFRIYPCGKIEKLKWEEVHPNEETGANDYVTTPECVYNNTNYPGDSYYDDKCVDPYGSIVPCTGNR